MSQFEILANEVLNYELSDSGLTIPEVSGWFSNNIGALNNFIYTEYIKSGGGTSPELGIEESSILKDMYLYKFYNDQRRKVGMGAVSLSGAAIQSVKEGDSSITFVNRGNIAQMFGSLAKDFYTSMNDKRRSYLLYKAAPKQVLLEE